MAEAPYTLTRVSKLTGISMPTLQRYKKLYQDRIPSIGEGRTQRYPEEALAVFQQIKEENLKKRGRPKKSAGAKKKTRKATGSRKKGAAKGRKKGPAKGSGTSSAKKRGRKKAAATADDDKELLSLSEIGRRTGISYPTLLRYVKLHLDRIPHQGSGRTRRYPPEAVEVFRDLRASSRRGRRKGGGARKAASKGSGTSASRLRALERSQARLEKKLDRLIKKLSKPLV